MKMLTELLAKALSFYVKQKARRILGKLVVATLGIALWA